MSFRGFQAPWRRENIKTLCSILLLQREGDKNILYCNSASISCVCMCIHALKTQILQTNPCDACVSYYLFWIDGWDIEGRERGPRWLLDFGLSNWVEWCYHWLRWRKWGRKFFLEFKKKSQWNKYFWFGHVVFQLLGIVTSKKSLFLIITYS